MTWTQQRREALIAEVEGWPRRVGKNEYLAYLCGEYLSAKKRILAECFRCSNGYIDGTFDCENPDCPLHRVMPYRGRRRTIWEQGRPEPCSDGDQNESQTTSPTTTAEV
jgi:hypothetical protein